MRPASLIAALTLGLLSATPSVAQTASENVYAQAARTHKTHWAILPPNLGYAQRCVEMGCKMLSLGIDTWAVQRGLKAFQAEFAAISE